MNYGSQVNMGLAAGGQAVQPPSTPPMNYGSQVDLGSTEEGFTPRGLHTGEEIEDYMRKYFSKPLLELFGVEELDEQLKSQLPVGGGGGGGAESMNRLLSRDVYSNTSSSTATPVQSEGGASSMNQLLSRPAYSKQVAEGGFLGYNQGGMPSQSQPYFEGQVQGPGDGQSDEVAF
ncbi:MAG: hypothetical protein ACO3UU_15875, partial [Minisyncoccia bacterium]